MELDGSTQVCSTTNSMQQLALGVISSTSCVRVHVHTQGPCEGQPARGRAGSPGVHQGCLTCTRDAACISQKKETDKKIQ